MSEELITEGVYPVLPLRDIIVFPHVVVPLFVGRDKSVAALENAMANNKQVFLTAQVDALVDAPYTGDLYKTGTIANILQLLKLPDGTVKILVEGVCRAKVIEWTQNTAFFEAQISALPSQFGNEAEVEALMRSVQEQFENYVRLNKRIGPEVLVAVMQIHDAEKFADIVATHVLLKLEDKQKILEIESVQGRLEKLYADMEKEIGVLQWNAKFASA